MFLKIGKRGINSEHIVHINFEGMGYNTDRQYPANLNSFQEIPDPLPKGFCWKDRGWQRLQEPCVILTVSSTEGTRGVLVESEKICLFETEAEAFKRWFLANSNDLFSPEFQDEEYQDYLARGGKMSHFQFSLKVRQLEEVNTWISRKLEKEIDIPKELYDQLSRLESELLY